MYNVAVIVGSLRKESINRKLAFALAKLAPPELQLTLLSLDGLPVYNQDYDSDMPPEALRLKAASRRPTACCSSRPSTIAASPRR